MLGCQQLRIVFSYRRGVDKQVDVIGDVFCHLLHHHRNSQRPHPRQIVGFVDIRPADAVALRVQNIGQRAHPRAADAGKINMMNGLQKILFHLP